jgi:flagellar basal-body rod modification protein FlgD
MLELEDLTSGQRWLLNTTSSIRLLVTRGSQRALQLTARIGHFDRTVITSVQLRGSRGEGRSVELQVSGPASVTLTVRGLGGRMVRQLTATATAAGPLVVGWDGRDQNGRAVPRGSYLLEAVAQSDNGAMSRVVRTVTIN